MQNPVAGFVYHHLLNTAPDAIFVADAETGTVLDANASAAQLLGIPVEHIIGMHQSQLHPPEEADRYRKIFEDHVRTGAGFVVDNIYVQHKSGRKIPVQINASVTQIGNQILICGIFRDITEQQRLLKELQDSQERFKRLAETTFEAIVIHKDGEFIDANTKLFEMFGYTEQELRQMNGLEVIAPSSRDLVKKNMSSMNTGSYEAMGLRKDGTVFPIEIHARTSSIGGQSVRIGAIRDLTAQKEMEQQILENEKKYRQLYRQARVALYRNGIEDSRLLECNDAYAQQLGYENREQCLAECEYTIKHYANPAKRAEFLNLLKRDGAVYNYPTELVRRDGVHIWVEASVKMYAEEGYVEGVHFDITASKVLTRTEKRILTYIMQGKCNKEIARLLRRSVRTVEDHRSNMMHKLHVSNLIELIQKAHFMRIDSLP